MADYERLFGHPVIDDRKIDQATGEITPLVTIVTDNGGPFRSFRFEAFIAGQPELDHVRTRVNTPGQNGSRERGFGTLKYERLYIDEIDYVLMTDAPEQITIEMSPGEVVLCSTTACCTAPIQTWPPIDAMRSS